MGFETVIPEFLDYERSALFDELETSNTAQDIDEAFDSYDKRREKEIIDKLDFDDNDDYDEYYYEDDTHIDYYNKAKKVTNIGTLSTLIGNSHIADQLGLALAFGEEMSLEERKEVAEPISGKEQKELMSRDFSKIRRNVTPLESYAEAHMKEESQQYLKAINNSLDTLYNNIFTLTTNDFYNFLISSKVISSKPNNLAFKHLKTLKEIADIAIGLAEYNILVIVKYLVEVKKINLEEGLVK
jgi:hypothetical protein